MRQKLPMVPAEAPGGNKKSATALAWRPRHAYKLMCTFVWQSGPDNGQAAAMSADTAQQKQQPCGALLLGPYNNTSQHTKSANRLPVRTQATGRTLHQASPPDD